MWAGAAAVLVLAVALVLASRSRQRAPSVHYETATVDEGAIAAHVTATGALSALVTVSVGSQVSGRIEHLFADFGSTVERGQIIASIEPSLFQSAAAQARAALLAARAETSKAAAQATLARDQEARGRSLVAQRLISTQDYEVLRANVEVADATVRAARASVAQAQAALKQAQQNLDYCTIRSPIDGVVISRNVDVGQTVAAAFQAPVVFTIAQDLTKMQVDTNVAEADVGKIRAGMPVTFTVDAYPTRKFTGVVRQVRDNAQTIQNVVTYDAVIDVDNRERLLKPSMTATVTFAYASRDRALRVRNAALRFRPSSAVIERMLGGPLPPGLTKNLGLNERLVWTLRGERVVPARVRVGISDGAYTELLGGGLHRGDHVVTEASLSASGSRRPL